MRSKCSETENSSAIESQRNNNVDADDWLHPQTIERQVEYLQNPHILGVMCARFRVDEKSHIEFKPESPTKVPGEIALGHNLGEALKKPVLSRANMMRISRMMKMMPMIMATFLSCSESSFSKMP